MDQDSPAPKDKKDDTDGGTPWSDVFNCTLDVTFWELAGYVTSGCIRGVGALIAALFEY